MFKLSAPPSKIQFGDDAMNIYRRQLTRGMRARELEIHSVTNYNDALTDKIRKLFVIDSDLHHDYKDFRRRIANICYGFHPLPHHHLVFRIQHSTNFG